MSVCGVVMCWCVPPGAYERVWCGDVYRQELMSVCGVVMCWCVPPGAYERVWCGDVLVCTARSL